MSANLIGSSPTFSKRSWRAEAVTPWDIRKEHPSGARTPKHLAAVRMSNRMPLLVSSTWYHEYEHAHKKGKYTKYTKYTNIYIKKTI